MKISERHIVAPSSDGMMLFRSAAGASPYSMGAASGTATPLMSPAPTQDSMGYSLPAPGYEPQPGYDGSMGGYDPMHQDLSP